MILRLILVSLCAFAMMTPTVNAARTKVVVKTRTVRPVAVVRQRVVVRTVVPTVVRTRVRTVIRR